MTSPTPPAETPPIACVAVSTRNRSAGLRRLVAALEEQTVGAEAFELIVFDDASEDDTPAVLREVAERSPLRITTMRSETNRGAAAGRNAAWRTGTASIVAFTDDDCYPTPQWLERGIEASEAGSSVVVGSTEPDPAQRDRYTPLARTIVVTDAKDAAFAPTANVFYRRADLEAVGGFDESFGLLGGEDTDLAWRVKRNRGRELRFVPEALVFHDVRPRTTREAVAETRRWAGLAIVAKRHPALARASWHRGFFIRGSHPWVILAAIGVAIGLVFPPALALTVPWLRHRIFRGAPKPYWIRMLAYAPGLFAVDLTEVGVLASASVRYRTVLL